MGKANRLRRERKKSAVRYLHGGAPGLEVGDILRGRNALRAWDGVAVSYVYDHDGSLMNDAGQGEFVYITSDVDVAHLYAHQYQQPLDGKQVPGDVYEVEPLGALHNDPDNLVHGSRLFARVTTARITSVVARGVILQEDERDRYAGRYLCWTDGSPVYDADGYMMPSPEVRAQGFTAADLRPYGKWHPVLQPPT